MFQRNFAWEWSSALAVKSLFAGESRVGTMPGDERSTLLTRYDLWCRRGARLKWMLDFLGEAVPAALAMFFVISTFVVPISLWDSGNLGRVALVGELVVLFGSGVMTATVVAETRPDRVSTLFALTAIAVGLAATLTIGGPWAVSVGEASVEWSSPLGLLILLGSCLLTIFCVVVLSLVGSLATRLFAKYVSRSRREELTLYSLALVLVQLVDRAPGERRLPSPGHLRSVAACLEGLGGTVDLTDARHRRVFRDRIRSAALAVREKALWIALPKVDTQAALRTFVVGLMTAVLEGTYDELPVTPAGSPAKRWRRTKAFAVLLRTLVVGAFPVGVLWLIHRLGVPLPDPLGATATLFAVLWASITVLTALDPALRERVDLLRSVTGLLSGPKPDK
ncbi:MULTISPECIES: hypothetical protein [Amycolatopsis]|uniref:hypothetical protein n=1 Tax=Amycolatopsis TaxID=1813 RepID=UPI00174BFCB6|nr:hypothetical protein [Amycolatopsis bullii]